MSGWVSGGLALAGSIAGGMGGSKAGERMAKDSAAMSNYGQERQLNQYNINTAPYRQAGAASQNLLAQYLGVGTPEGYAPKPEYNDVLTELQSVWNKSGKVGRNTNVAALQTEARKRYEQKLADWERGLAEFQEANPESRGDGRLLKPFTNEDFVKDPGYEARLAEGNTGVERFFAAKGASDSGAIKKALTRFNQDYASNEFGNAYARDMTNKNSIYNMLSGQAGMGLGATQGVASAGQNAANQAGATNQNLANNVWNAQLQQNENQANALQSGIGNLLYGIRRGNQSVFSGGAKVPDGGYGGMAGGGAWG